MEKKYNHSLIEKGKYEKWLEAGYFKSGDEKKQPYCIVIPPPNVTGNLHLGHAWDVTLQDIITRYKRMDGFDALWLPGMDHAGIATQAKVDAKLRSEGINPRAMDRDLWLEKAWQWKEEYAQNIRQQWAKLGLSLDYDRERFTLDEGLCEAVHTVFLKLYEKGLIYRGEYIINWDPVAKTALSNEEVIYQEQESDFYFIRYYLVNEDKYLTVATTRPETLFGDVAVAVAPDDERYQAYIGKKVLLPVVNKEIPIIADDYVDKDFGTGVLKITPAHDVNDFEVGKRHKMDPVLCLNPDGTMNEKAAEFTGLDRFVCREKVVAFLKENDLLERVEKIKNAIGYSERSNAIVESYLSKQWFVKMKPLAQQVLAMQKTDEKVNFVPPRFEKILIHWMENVHDWCISRQLWWGHRIPAWYKGDEMVVASEKPGEGYEQDPDVLDTWFSSALWPFSTLGWPDNFEDRYFPNNCLVTGYDIIFFWVSRMIFTSVEFTGKRPFNDVLIHGLIRDKQGRKMSKSLGNGVDPMDVVEEYGADALRFFLATNSAPGQDLRYDKDKVMASWNFNNKLWNAARFVLMTDDKKDVALSKVDKWILHKMNNLVSKVRRHMEKYEFNIVGMELYNFIWSDYCDWYIEFSKVNRNDKVLRLVLTNILKMLHPFMPYITEELYQQLNNDDSLMISSYPVSDKKYCFADEISEVEELKEIISKIRNAQKELGIPKGFKLINKLENKSIIDDNMEVLKQMLRCEFCNDSDLEKHEISFGSGAVILCYPMQDQAGKKQKLMQEKEKLIISVERRKKLLDNDKYVNNAPKEVVEEDRIKLLKEEKELKNLEKELKKL